MKPEVIARRVKTDVPTHYGCQLYAVVGSYQQLASVEKALADAGLPAAVGLNAQVMEALGDHKLDKLMKFEARSKAAIVSEMTMAYRSVLQSKLLAGDLAVLKEFELLFQYGVDLNVARNYAIDGKAIVMLVPGREDGGTVFAYGSGDMDDTEFFPGLFDPEHIWEVD